MQNAVHGVFHFFSLLADILQEIMLIGSQALRIALKCRRCAQYASQRRSEVMRDGTQKSVL